MRPRRQQAVTSWFAGHACVGYLQGPVRSLNTQAPDAADHTPAQFAQESRHSSRVRAIADECVAREEHDLRLVAELAASLSQGVLAWEAAERD